MKQLNILIICLLILFVYMNILRKRIHLDKIKSVDRIVPNGKSSDISLEWDGYDIFFQISKKLTII